MTLSSRLFSILVVLFFISVPSCQKSSNNFPFFQTDFKGATPGVVNLAITPLGGFAVDMLFEISGGSPKLPIQCSFAMYDYSTNPNTLVNNLFIYFLLDSNGSASIPIENTLCSLGSSEQAYITWSCNINGSPFQKLSATNTGGNAFYFNCRA